MGEQGQQRKIFFRAAEVCPDCGAVESFRKGVTGTSVKKTNGDRFTYVTCVKCGCKAIRIVRTPDVK